MEKKFEYLDTEIYYQVKGNGHCIVLLHGFAEDHDIWNEQVNFLQEYCKLIIPDLPGSGKSEMFQNKNTTFEDYAASLNALLVNENIDKCTLLGHSMGGYITLAFANQYPEKLTAFGLVHSTAFADSDEKKVTREKGIKFMHEYGVFPFLKNATSNLFSDNYKKQKPEKVAELIEKGKAFSAEALIHYYSLMINRPDRIEVLKESRIPVLFVIGDEDKAAPINDLLQQVHLPNISYVYLITGAGHMSMWEVPELVNSNILEFLTSSNKNLLS